MTGQALGFLAHRRLQDPLEALQELDTRYAVKSEIRIEMAARVEIRGRDSLVMQFQIKRRDLILHRAAYDVAARYGCPTVQSTSLRCRRRRRRSATNASGPTRNTKWNSAV